VRTAKLSLYRDGRTDIWRSRTPFDPTIERKAYVILIAPMFQDSAIIGHRGEIETIFHILPVDNLSSPSCDHYHALHLAMPRDGREVWLNSATEPLTRTKTPSSSTP
jgi:hypothetical protein